METLHSLSIIYRDLKPDNVMIDATGHIKLIDFGFAKVLTKHNNFRTSTNCGTVGYTAPELISGAAGYSFPADIWSFGILLAELLSGVLPFEEKNDPFELQQQIVKGQIKLQKDFIDPIARDLFNKILVVEPNMRITLE